MAESVRLVDTHCHIHEALLSRVGAGGAGGAAGGNRDGDDGGEEDADDGPTASAPVEDDVQLDACVDGVARAVTMGTRPADWAAVAALRLRYGERAWPAFGVHPWHAFRVRSPADGSADLPRWCSQLRRRLEAHPTAVLGEIGLDKVAKVPGTAAVAFERQLAVFRWQLALAADLQRPVSVHCVHATGPLLQLLQDPRTPLPPTLAMHSYTGSVDTIRALTQLRRPTLVFFGFSACICLRAPEKARAAIAAVPADRLLLESDHADPTQVLAGLDTILRVVCEVKRWPASEACRRTAANADRWLRIVPTP